MHAFSESLKHEAWMEAWTELKDGRFTYEIVSERGSDAIRTKVLRTVLDREQEVVNNGDGDKAEAVEQLREDMARQAILERLGWSFVRVRGSEYFLNPEKAMKPVFARLNELKIRAEGGSSSVEAPQNGKEVLERIVRRAAEYRQHWVTQAKAQLARSGNGVAERARKPARSAKKKRKASARK